MKHYFKYQGTLIIIIILSIHSGYAQDSLSFYLEIAAKNNPGVKAKYLEYSASLEKVPQASSLPDPEVQFGYFIKPMMLLGGNQVADVRLMQMFPWFGLLKASKDEASKMAVSKFENFRDAKDELYFNVKSSYYKVYRTIMEISIAKKNLGILHSLEQIAIVRFQSAVTGSSPVSSGKGSAVNTNGSMSGQNQASMASSSNKPAMTSVAGGMGGSMPGGGKNGMVNVLRAQIEIHELENRIALLEDQLNTDKISFNRFLNRSSSTQVSTSDSLQALPVSSDILTLADSIVNHPMVKMYEAESDANAAKLRKVYRMGYPMLGLGLNYSVIQQREGVPPMMNGKDMIMPMVSLTLPIYRKKYKAMRHEAELMRDAASESAENITHDLGVNFSEALQSLNDARRRIKLYSEEAMLAYKSEQLLLTSFSNSGADFEEVLRMEQQLLDYQYRQVEAVVDNNTSIAQIVYLTGSN